jgi:hypothetical protein
MAQNNWTVSTFLPEQWTDSSDWSLMHVPTGSEDAYVGTNSGSADVQSSINETVNSVATSSNDNLAILGGLFTASTGTGPNANLGTISVDDATLLVVNGTVDNTGTIKLNSTSTNVTSTFLIQNAVTLDGGGALEMAIGAAPGNNLITGVSPSASLVNYDDISGTGTISGLVFDNTAAGTIETNNSTSSNPGFLNIAGTAGGGRFVNDGAVQADNGGTIEFGVDGQSSSLTNDATISLLGSSADTDVQIAGNVTINSSDGEIGMGGSDPSDDFIVSDGHAASLTLNGGTLKGAGTVGDANLTLNNVSATIDADTSSPLDLDTGGNTITNGGTLEATNGGSLAIESPVNNSGTIAVSAPAGTESFLGIFAAVSGSGTVDIGTDGYLVLEEADFLGFQAGSVAGNVQFNGPGLLALSENITNGGIGGQIVGATDGDGFFIGAFNFVAGEHAVWDQTSSSGGTLSLYSHGTDLYTLDLAGQYTSLNFVVGDLGTTTVIDVQNTLPYTENPGNNDEWILSDGYWAASAGPGPGPTDLSGNPYQVAGIGDWTGGDTDGILWYNPLSGDTDEWQLSNAQWAGSVDLGTHPNNATDNNLFQISGTGDFTDDGIDDVLWTSVNSNGTVATDIWELNSSGQWMASSSPGNHPAGYSVAGIGDWTGDGVDGILWYSSPTGDTDEWQLADGKWAASVDLGSHPTNATDGNSYQISGIGDFTDDGIDDVLWTSVNSDGTVATDIWELSSSGQWMASVSPGNHPAGYQVVAVGDTTGTGTSDIIWYNSSTGDVDEWLINNGQWAQSIDLGTHPGNFQIAGLGDFNGDGTNDILWHA